MKLKLLTLVVVVGLFSAFVYFLTRQSSTSTPSVSATPTSAPTMSLPQNWQVLTSSSGSAYQIEKSGNYVIRPLVITSQAALPELEKPQDYFDRLIAGAKSSLYGLKYSQNQDKSTATLGVRHLTGSYYSGKNKVNLYQRLYQKAGQVYVLSASCVTDSCTSSEVQTIFDTLWLRLSN